MRVGVSAEAFESVVRECYRHSVQVAKWIEIFKRNNEAYELSERKYKPKQAVPGIGERVRLIFSTFV